MAILEVLSLLFYFFLHRMSNWGIDCCWHVRQQVLLRQSSIEKFGHLNANNCILLTDPLLQQLLIQSTFEEVYCYALPPNQSIGGRC